MRLRLTLTVATACALLFAVSFAAGSAWRDEEKPPEGPPARAASPGESAPSPGPRRLALGRAPSLPGLRTPPPRREPVPRVAPVVETAAEPVADSAPETVDEPVAESAPAARKPVSTAPRSRPAPPTPVEPRQPGGVPAPPPAVSLPRGSASVPVPDGAPRLPRPTPDPAPPAAGGSRYYDPDG